MERLTHRREDGTILIERHGEARDSFSNYMLPTDIAAVRRLAAYENTGLTPEEIELARIDSNVKSCGLEVNKKL